MERALYRSHCSSLRAAAQLARVHYSFRILRLATVASQSAAAPRALQRAEAHALTLSCTGWAGKVSATFKFQCYNKNTVHRQRPPCKNLNRSADPLVRTAVQPI